MSEKTNKKSDNVSSQNVTKKVPTIEEDFQHCIDEFGYNIDPTKCTRGSTSKSIRFMSIRHSTEDNKYGKISTILQRRPQHVRNVLITPLVNQS